MKMSHSSVGNVQVYKWNDGVPLASQVRVSVNGTDIPVLSIQAGSIVSFGISGPVVIRFMWKKKPSVIAIHPAANKEQVTETSDGIEITLSCPCKLCIETENQKPLYVLANSPEVVPERTVRIEARPGEIYSGPALQMRSGEHLFIPGGAVIRAPISIENSENVTISGYGLIDGSFAPNHGAEGVINGETFATLLICKSKKIHVQGVTIVNSPGWSCPIAGSSQVVLDGTNIINDDHCDDGIDIVGSKEVTVRNGLIATNDDCIAIKAVNYGILRTDARTTVRNIAVEQCILRNGPAGNVLEIGFETQTDSISDIQFRNLDVIGAHGYNGVFTIHNGDRAVITNILYENIRVEHYFNLLIDFRILNSRWSVDQKRGHIRKITFRNISLCQDSFNTPSLIGGCSADHRVSDVLFENVTRNGQPVHSLDELEIFCRFAENIRMAEQ